MTHAKILAFAGSARKESYNKKLIKIAAEGARAAGAEVTMIDLRDFPLPLFDEDLEAQGEPENAKKLKEIFAKHNGLLLACPEYNSSITPLLKNTIDWVSRPQRGEKTLQYLSGKTAAIMSASPSGFGGLRGLVTVRSILGNIGVLVLPSQAVVSKANEAFENDGSLKDKKLESAVKALAAELAKILAKLN